jgi:methyl-accepting chemotaxis protein
MRGITARLAGILLIFGAIIGTITALAGMIIIWRVEPAVSESLTGTIDLLDATLSTSSDAMLMMNGSFLQMKDSLGVIRLSLEDASRTMQSTANATNSVADLIGEDLNTVVTDTQLSLLSVQNSARMIDNTLSLISSIPLIGPSLGGGYRRDMPLEASIGEVSTGLESVPNSLLEVQTGLNQTARNFELMKNDLDDLIETIDEVETGLLGAEVVMNDYQEIISISQDRLQDARTATPNILRMLLWGGTTFFVWLLIAQLGLLIHGLDLLLHEGVVEQKI